MESKDQNKSKCIAELSHELRTPLTVISSTVNNFIDGAFGELTETQKKWIKKLGTHTAHLEELVSRILANPEIVPENGQTSEPIGKRTEYQDTDSTPKLDAQPRPTGHTPKVLVVDDEPDILDTIEAGLEPFGYEIITTLKGTEAVALAVKDPPDLVLMDLNLGSENGLEVCRNLKAQVSRFIPVILITGQDDFRQKITGDENQADDLLSKPFHMQELYSRVSSMLNLKKLRDDLDIQLKISSECKTCAARKRQIE